jgi:phosphoesterase RecJ-like protein
MSARPPLNEIAAAIRAAPAVTLACHTNPDGDAIGSLLGMSLIVAKAGARVTASWAGDVGLPSNYSFLPGAEALVPTAEVKACDVFVALDCGDLDRLGALSQPATASKVLINIDHHPGNPNFGHLNAVVTTASSTAELVAHLAGVMDVPLDDAIALCLYTGIVTDTGRFQYQSTSPETLELVARLRRFDFDASRISQEIYESASFSYLKLVGRMLTRASLETDERFVHSYITQADLKELGVDLTDTENLIDVIRAIRDAEVAAMFKEQNDGKWRVSLRSKAAVSVGEIARANGGGGHELAAGFTTDSLESGVAAIATSLRPRSG